MGSNPTLAQQQLAAEALGLDPGDWEHDHADAHLAVEHPQVRAWPEGDPDLAHQLDDHLHGSYLDPVDAAAGE